MLEVIKNLQDLQNVRDLFAKNVKELAHRLRDDHNSIWSYHGIDDVSGTFTQFYIYIASNGLKYQINIKENNGHFNQKPHIVLLSFITEIDEDYKEINRKPKDLKEIKICHELA